MCIQKKTDEDNWIKHRGVNYSTSEFQNTIECVDVCIYREI